MVAANPLWRAPRIHGELTMLGIEISERTVSRILRRLPRPPGQTWKTFLRNHLGQMVSIDFFTVPTITLKVLFVFIVLEHRRREVLHFNVTDHPTAAWDRDGVYGSDVRSRMASQEIEEILTPSDSSARSAESVWTTCVKKTRIASCCARDEGGPLGPCRGGFKLP
jgi:putative transposase